jgi:hypothetical protein
MAAEKTDGQIREELQTERAALADAVDDLRGALDVTSALRAKLPLAAAGAFGLGFWKAGGIGATMRLFMRRSREHDVRAQVGRFRLIDRG